MMYDVKELDFIFNFIYDHERMLIDHLDQLDEIADISNGMLEKYDPQNNIYD